VKTQTFFKNIIMAIIKQAKNINIKVSQKHIVLAKTIEKTAETIKIMATYGNIELYSEKTIKQYGNIN